MRGMFNDRDTQETPLVGVLTKNKEKFTNPSAKSSWQILTANPHGKSFRQIEYSVIYKKNSNFHNFQKFGNFQKKQIFTIFKNLEIFKKTTISKISEQSNSRRSKTWVVTRPPLVKTKVNFWQKSILKSQFWQKSIFENWLFCRLSGQRNPWIRSIYWQS